LSSRVGYAASRISSNLEDSNKQFGWLQDAATRVSCLSITSANPATIRICIPQWSFEKVGSRDAAKVDIDTLDQRLIEELRKAGAIYIGDMIFLARVL
jgi:hypothetical protein